MKAHVYHEPKLALVWNLGEDKPGYAALVRACKRFNLPMRAVAPEQAGEIVGTLLGVPGAQKAKTSLTLEPDAYPAAILVSGIDKQIDEFVDTLNDYGVPLPLKAMATPTNRTWPFAELLENLLRDHEAMHR